MKASEPAPTPEQRSPAEQAPAPGQAAGAPVLPLHLASIYVAASAMLWLAQGLSMNLISVNTSQLQGMFGATLSETYWLVAAYMAPNVSLTILLIKIRTQFGLRRFAEISIAVFAASSLLHLWAGDFWSAIPVRFLAGVAASPISTLGFLYMLEAFPAQHKGSWGLSLALTCSVLSPTIARLISPSLLQYGSWQHLYSLEMGLGLICLALVYLLPLTPTPRANVLHWRDFISFPLIAIGFGLIAVVLVLGQRYWWLEAPWIGACLAAACVCIGIAGAIELNRDTPLVDLRWLASPEILHFTLTLVVFRIVLAEQTSGAIGLFQTLGLVNEQSSALYLVVLGASVAGGLVCGATLRGDRVHLLYMISLICVAAGAWMDAHSVSMTRPADMYLSQGLIAFGGAVFLPPAIVAGLAKTLAKGPTYITSFVVVFLFTQKVGGLAGSALFGTFVQIREQFHSARIVDHLSRGAPVVVARIGQLSSAFGRVLTDPALLQAEGAAQLAKQASQQAYVLAYDDAFFAVFVIAVAGFLIIACQEALARIRIAMNRPTAPALVGEGQ